jgi:hypothetical protein
MFKNEFEHFTLIGYFQIHPHATSKYYKHCGVNVLNIHEV